MLLQSILEELDGELTRLQDLRRLVAGLRRTSTVVGELPTMPEAVSAEVPTPTSVRRGRPGRAASLPRAPRVPQAHSVPEPSALAPTVSADSAEVLAAGVVDSEPETTATFAPMIQEDLDALSRSLAARWNTGPVG